MAKFASGEDASVCYIYIYVSVPMHSLGVILQHSLFHEETSNAQLQLGYMIINIDDRFIEPALVNENVRSLLILPA